MMLAALVPASQIRTDFRLEAFFPEDDPTIVQYRAVSEEFGPDDNIIAVLFEHPEVLSEPVLNDLRSITDALAVLEHVTSVDALTTANRLVNEGGTLRTDPVWKPGTAPPVLDSVLTNPFVRDIILNRTGTATAVYVTVDTASDPFAIRQSVIEGMRSILEPHMERYAVGITGIPYFRNEYVNMLNREILVYVSTSTLLVMVILAGLFRNIRGVVLPLGIVWLTILFTVAVVVMTGGFFEVLSSTVAPILLCVGISDSIHILAKYNDARLDGLTRRAAMRDTITVMGSATFLTSITTFIGFATLLTSNVMPIRRFGIYTAAGVLIAFAITMLLIPSILPRLKDRPSGSDQASRLHLWLGEMLRRLDGWIERRHKPIVIATLAVTILVGLGAANLKINSFIFDDVGPDTVLMRDADRFSTRLSPPFPLEIVLDTGTENGVVTPEFLGKIRDLQVFLDSIPEIARSTSLLTLLRETHRVMQPGSPEGRLYEEGAGPLLAQYLLLLEMADPEILEPLTDFTYGKIRVAAQVQDAGSYRINGIRRDIRHHLQANFPEVTVQQSGTSILVADLTGNMVQSLTSSILLAVLFIGGIMAWLFRNGRLILISMIPNLLPLVITAGIMGYFGIDLKPSTAVIFTIAFGIAVDDTIHYLARLRLESWRGDDIGAVIRVTTEKTGRAILLTSVILLAGFGSLMTSDFSSTVWMGSLVSLTVLTALVADLVFLPALLYWVRPRLRETRDQMSA
jgi:hypothetical protein